MFFDHLSIVKTHLCFTLKSIQKHIFAENNEPCFEKYSVCLYYVNCHKCIKKYYVITFVVEVVFIHGDFIFITVINYGIYLIITEFITVIKMISLNGLIFYGLKFSENTNVHLSYFKTGFLRDKWKQRSEKTWHTSLELWRARYCEWLGTHTSAVIRQATEALDWHASCSMAWEENITSDNCLQSSSKEIRGLTSDYPFSGINMTNEIM